MSIVFLQEEQIIMLNVITVKFFLKFIKYVILNIAKVLKNKSRIATNPYDLVGKYIQSTSKRSCFLKKERGVEI